MATGFRPQRSENVQFLPLYLSHVEAGFPSAADDYIETELDLSKHLINNEEATFFVRVSGSSRAEAGIHDGDILAVDRSMEPEDRAVVVAALDTELTVKRYEVHSGHPDLMPENSSHDPVPVREGQELIIWGVVQHVMHEVS
ncbi:umuD protein [Salinibacter sp. 10B]|nr:umuD protein [Salinibacter sp. 10B]